MGWEYEVIEEQESTRKTRPKKYELMQRLRAGDFDGVCIYKLDRWARSSQELTQEITELHNKKLDFVSLTDGIDLNSSTGKLQFQILSAFAEFERNLISERTKEGLARARKNGVKLGRPRKK
jgi:DNA invertase Pin-like site-specific DNA recombinase